MEVTESGITMLVSEVQPLKARLPIVVTELGITTLASEVQSLKTLPPMEVTGKLLIKPFIRDGILTELADPVYL